MRFDVISSGSKGNATLVFDGETTLLLDFGISKKRVEKALEAYGKSFQDISAVFLSHTHSDHASDAFNTPLEKLYAPQPNVPKVKELLSGEHLLTPFSKTQIGCLSIQALPVSHDCPNTMAYLVEDGKESLVYLTDTGFVPEKDFPYLQGKTYYIFESNHDPKMLYESKRPDYLIRRIISDRGHLSNMDSGYYLSILLSSDTKEIVLAHLSEECNKPDLALSTVKEVIVTQLGYLPECLFKVSSASHETRGGEE